MAADRTEQQNVQDAILRRMTPQQKLEAAMQLYYSCRQLKTAWIHQCHPDWPQQQVEQAVKEAFANARN
jgi:hypothetical protein